MTDIMSDGQPYETPIGGAAAGYAATPPSWPEAMAALYHESSTLEPLTRWADRAQYDPEGFLGRAMAVAGEGGGEALALPLSARSALPSMEAQPSPMLAADDANARYAPMGPDGKPVPITDRPIPEGVAQLVGKAKADEIARQGVLARFTAAHSMPVAFGAGAAAFMMDPLNLAATFLPGFGEEAMIARLGALGGRLVAGAATGAAAQAPLSAIKYLTGRDEASDYELRDAFRDVAFSAAGAAALQAGFGALGDLIGRRGRAPAVAPGESEAAGIVNAPAPAKYDAMGAAVAQVAEGRPVDVEPVLGAETRSRVPRAPPKPVDLVEFLASSGGLSAQAEAAARGELEAIGAEKMTVPFRGRLVREGGLSLDYAREAAEEAGYLPPGSDIGDLIQALDRSLGGKPVFSARDESDALTWREHQAHGNEAAPEPFDPNEMFGDVAEEQQRLERDGYAPGMSDGEMSALERDAYFPDQDEATSPSSPSNEEEKMDTTAGGGLEGDLVHHIGPVRFSDWQDIGNGYAIRQSTTHPMQDIRTPEGNVITRGLDAKRREYWEYEMGHHPMEPGGMAWVEKAKQHLSEVSGRAGAETNLPRLAAPNDADFHPGDAVEIARAQAAVDDAGAKGAAYQEAGACLAGAMA